MSDVKPDPRCAGACGRLAADMEYLDSYVFESAEARDAVEEDELRLLRVEYVRLGDGTYNKATGGFWCDPCYIAVGMPLGVAP